MVGMAVVVLSSSTARAEKVSAAGIGTLHCFVFNSIVHHQKNNTGPTEDLSGC
jgi:hypothetical protein